MGSSDMSWKIEATVHRANNIAAFMYPQSTNTGSLNLVEP
jgi:hypothetical protein